MFLSLTSFIFFQFNFCAHSNEFKKNALGIRFGISNYREEDFLSYELFGRIGLPWLLILDKNGNWQIETLVSYSLGLLDQSGDTAFLGTFGPAIAIINKPTGLIFDTGSGGALISEDKVGGHNFGGNFQFTAHGGISYIIGWNITLGYRFFHVSDAGIINGHGLNRHLSELSYRF